MGTPKIREAIENGTAINDITESYKEELNSFSKLREPYLLYK